MFIFLSFFFFLIFFVFVTHFHHVQSFWRIYEDAVEYVQHAGSFARRLRSQSAEQPIQSISVGELSAVGVISLDDRS